MVSPLTRAALNLQVALLRWNWMGGMGKLVMVITTTGRRSGRRIATPIAYVRDGETVLALTHAPSRSNWYANLRAQPEALLEIRGEAMPVRAEFIEDEPGRQAAVAAFRRAAPAQFPRLVGVAADAPAEQLARAVSERRFVRFRRKPPGSGEPS
jgi:deazaflavin-dependent oxidoreductase (nitroreductase family)